MTEKITILSVFHSPESKRLLELNFDLVEKLNPDAAFEWVVADNSPSQSSPLAVREGEDKGGRYLIIPGLSGIDAVPKNIPDWIKSSFHHNIAMNISIPYIKTRFTLFLDSDFYILQRNWIKKVVEYMQKNNLTFLGTPWHPKVYKVFRYFPCHQCLFVDFEKLKEAGYKPSDLDFTPLEYGNAPQKSPEKKFGKISRLINIFNFKERRLVGRERHTAHRIFEKFSCDLKIKFEVIPAVFKPNKESYPAINLIYSLNKFFEFFLPDRLCYIPKDKSYYFIEKFKKFGYCDAWSKGWEEYVWGGEPFGIHVRPIKQIKKGQSIEEIITILRECFLSFNVNI